MRTFPHKPLRRPDNLMHVPNEEDYCDHEFEWTQERVPVDDDGKLLAGGHERRFTPGVQFYFRVRQCVKCPKKIRVELYHETR